MIKLAVLGCVLLLPSLFGCGRGLHDVTFTVDEMQGGGYVLHIQSKKRHIKLITAEGILPVVTESCRVEVIGKGEDWRFKGRNGFYYGPSEVRVDKHAWDYCYAWVDQRREFLYLNAYWLDPPGKIVRSDVAGRYGLRGSGRKQ